MLCVLSRLLLCQLTFQLCRNCLRSTLFLTKFILSYRIVSSRMRPLYTSTQTKLYIWYFIYQIRNVVMLDIGSTIDLSEFMPFNRDISVCIFDSHRPFSLINLFLNDQVTICVKFAGNDNGRLVHRKQRGIFKRNLRCVCFV